MASQILLLSPSLEFDKLSIEAVTSEATGFPLERALDWNPNTWWKGTSTANQNIDFDFGEAVSCQQISLFINNFASLTGSESITIYYSADAISWTSLASESIANLTVPALYKAVSETSARYWRVAFTSITTIPEISMFSIGSYYLLSGGNQFPEDDGNQFNHDIFDSKSGHKFIRLINKEPQLYFSRNFVINGTTDWDGLNGIFRQSLGNGRPIVVAEPDGVGVMWCHILNKRLPKNEIEYQIYNPTVEFVSVSYTLDGEDF